jgi:23S rRNA pseudouridine2605 synthase
MKRSGFRARSNVLASHANGLARALSKLGFCSRSQAWGLIKAGRVKVNGELRLDPEWRLDLSRDKIEVDAAPLSGEPKMYLMLNKPRGLVTTSADERGRETVFQCFAGKHLPFIAPVGRLDQASEGLLLFTNDTQWAALITAPESRIEKTYHVQIDCLADELLLKRIRQGVRDNGEVLHAKRVTALRHGTRNSWLEIILDEGKNRHIRRLLLAFEIGVLRLVRVAVGGLKLGNLSKGQFRELQPEEIVLVRRS